MEPITLIAFVTAKPGQSQALLAQFSLLVPATRAEPGCQLFQVHQHPQDVDRFAVVEKFSNQAAFDAHLTYPHTRQFVQWLADSGTELQFESWQEQHFSD